MGLRYQYFRGLREEVTDESQGLPGFMQLMSVEQLIDPSSELHYCSFLRITILAFVSRLSVVHVYFHPIQLIVPTFAFCLVRLIVPIIDLHLVQLIGFIFKSF